MIDTSFYTFSSRSNAKHKARRLFAVALNAFINFSISFRKVYLAQFLSIGENAEIIIDRGALHENLAVSLP